MIISNNQIRGLIAQYLKQDQKFSAAKNDVPGQNAGDRFKKVDGLQDERVYSALKAVIEDLPDIREDRLTRIQKQVKTGTYEITDEEVAEKMIGRTLVDKLV